MLLGSQRSFLGNAAFFAMLVCLQCSFLRDAAWFAMLLSWKCCFVRNAPRTHILNVPSFVLVISVILLGFSHAVMMHGPCLLL